MFNPLQIGDVLHVVEDYYRVPPGTVIGHPDDSRNRWTKDRLQLWGNPNRGSGARPPEDWLPLGYYRVETYPLGYTPDPRERLTLAQWKWRFYEGTVAAAEIHGVTLRVVERMLERLDCSFGTFELGPGVVVESINTRATLPDDTVLFVGDQQDAANSGVYVKVAGRWRLALGDAQLNRRTATVAEMPGYSQPVDWAVETADDEDAIAVFRAKAEEYATSMADNQGWCSTYDSLAQRYGFARRPGH